MNHFGIGNLVEHNKAVRDKIPDIIKNAGGNCNVKKLSNEEFLLALEKKLTEEVKEYSENKSVEELTDILEVITRISELKDVSEDELEKIKKKKSQERGGFDDNLFLIDSSEKF